MLRDVTPCSFYTHVIIAKLDQHIRVLMMSRFIQMHADVWRSGRWI